MEVKGMRRLYIFDMDGTILPESTGLLELAKKLGTETQLFELEKQFSERRITTYQFTDLISKLWGEIDKNVSFSAFQDAKKIDHISECLAEIKGRGSVSCLITMSQDVFASHFSIYGFDHIFSSTYPPHSDEYFKILSPEDKPLIAMDLCNKYNLDFDECIAFGDSLSDEPLFSKLTETIAVNASPELKKISKYNYSGNSILEAYRMISF